METKKSNQRLSRHVGWRVCKISHISFGLTRDQEITKHTSDSTVDREKKKHFSLNYLQLRSNTLSLCRFPMRDDLVLSLARKTLTITIVVMQHLA